MFSSFITLLSQEIFKLRDLLIRHTAAAEIVFRAFPEIKDILAFFLLAVNRELWQEPGKRVKNAVTDITERRSMRFSMREADSFHCKFV